jgi:hypothetical protein
MGAESETFTIELDCPPGHVRPGDLIGGVVAGTGLPQREPVSKVFGQWTWDYSDVPGVETTWPEIEPVLKERISALYDSGAIRYGSW